MTGPRRGCDRESSGHPAGFGSTQGVSYPGVSDHLCRNHQGLIFKTWIHRPQLPPRPAESGSLGMGPWTLPFTAISGWCSASLLFKDLGPGRTRKNTRSLQPCNLTKPGQVLKLPLPLPPLLPAWKFLTSVLFSYRPIPGNHCYCAAVGEEGEFSAKIAWDGTLLPRPFPETLRVRAVARV